MAKKKAKPQAPKVSRIVYLRDKAYTALRKVVEWYESTPGPVDLDDNAHDQVADCMYSHLRSYVDEGENFSECFIIRGRMYMQVMMESVTTNTLEEQRVLILPRSQKPVLKTIKLRSKRKN
jgi:hypothetical protein